jgi:hypothetical protein
MAEALPSPETALCSTYRVTTVWSPKPVGEIGGEAEGWASGI